MSNLDNLRQKIVDDAKIKADEIVTEATMQKEVVINSKIDEAEREKKKTIEKAKRDAELLKERKVSGAQLQVRDQNLRIKRQVMDKVMNEAKNRLEKLDANKYKEFVDNNLKALKLNGNEVLLVQEGMEDTLKPAENYPTIARDEHVESGFIIKDESMELNFTFKSLIDYAREELESELASTLFNEQEWFHGQNGFYPKRCKNESPWN